MKNYNHALYEIAVEYADLGDYESAEKTDVERLQVGRNRVEKKFIEEKELAYCYGSMAWHQLFARHFQNAIESSLAGIELDTEKGWIDSERIWIAGNLAHGYLFTGQYDKAMEIYLRYIGEKNIANKLDWTQAVLQDFKKFREAGLVHPKMDEIEKILIEKTAEYEAKLGVHAIPSILPEKYNEE